MIYLSIKEEKLIPLIFAGNRDMLQSGNDDTVIRNSKVVKIMKDINIVPFIYRSWMQYAQ